MLCFHPFNFPGWRIHPYKLSTEPLKKINHVTIIMNVYLIIGKEKLGWKYYLVLTLLISNVNLFYSVINIQVLSRAWQARVDSQWNRHIETIKFRWMSKPVPNKTDNSFFQNFCRIMRGCRPLVLSQEKDLLLLMNNKTHNPNFVFKSHYIT